MDRHIERTYGHTYRGQMDGQIERTYGQTHREDG